MLAKCIRSIRRFPTNGGYDAYILHTNLTCGDCRDLEKQIQFPRDGNAFWEDVRLHFQAAASEAIDFFPDHNMRYPKTIYLRIFAARFLPDSIERILYLDPDIIVIRSLNEMYQLDFGDNFFWGCSHTGKLLTGIDRLRTGLPKGAAYINTGVLLMNLALLRKEQRLEEVAQYAAHHPLFFLPDQDIISVLYGARTGLLDPLRYNLSDRLLARHNMGSRKKKITLEWVRENGVIVHYYGRNKPWNENYRGILREFYEEV